MKLNFLAVLCIIMCGCYFLEGEPLDCDEIDVPHIGEWGRDSYFVTIA